MHIGIDVGGTHTDAVVLDHGEVVVWSKAVTDKEDLILSVRTVLDDILGWVDPAAITRCNLSTTLSTNAIVENRLEDVGVLVAAGPGIDPEDYRIGRGYFVIPGAMDHRGDEVRPLALLDLDMALALCRELSLRVFAAVTKFSTRNPAHELAIRDRLGQSVDFVSLGHRMSGLLNFPRRVATAYYNSAVWRIYNCFATAIEQSLRECGITASVNMLKADGGTMPLVISRDKPVEFILSGPAASIMGIIAMCDIQEDCVILDIGGTTTDIAIFATGQPLIEADGIEIGSYPTLVKALKTYSIGIGGDSRLHIVEDRVNIGPDRVGPCMARGGKTPTLMDAFNFLGGISFGDCNASVAGLKRLALLWDRFPESVAREAVEYAVETICRAIAGMVFELNQKPVYTIQELLDGKEVVPRKAYCMGGPALAFRDLLAAALGYEVEVPTYYEVANAIGAALTATTVELELFADTKKQRLFIPTLGEERNISAHYTLDDARHDACKALTKYLRSIGVYDLDRPVEVVEANVFNMVDSSGRSNRNIRVKCQIRPGIVR